MYRVKFVDLREQTIDTHDYENLFDAIKVAKKTNIGSDRVHMEAISNELFNEKFLTLLQTGFIVVGDKSEDYPDGDTMIMLLQRDELTGVEAALCAAVFPTFTEPTPIPVARQAELAKD
jgi:hypothetical protein